MSWQLSHLLDNSWWPLIMSLESFYFMVTTLFWFKFGFRLELLLLSMMGVVAMFLVWFRDVSRESAFQGHHTLLIQSALKWGLIWFLFSEVWFFFSVFWSFFHMSISPLSSGSFLWPSIGVTSIPPFQVPFLNTVILLMSGLTATLAHQELVAGKQTVWVFLSVLLGIYFVILQGLEYFAASFTISSSFYGSVFFFGTGFHGLHVCLGVTMLTVSNLRMTSMLVNSQHHFGLEFSLWYWHFVDVVWLFLFFWVYAWGS